MKTALVVLSDPAGGEDSLGRVFSALAAAKDFSERGEEVTLLFQGAGTRWASVLADNGHGLHALYTAVRSTIAGVGCVFDVLRRSRGRRGCRARVRRGERHPRRRRAAEPRPAQGRGILGPRLLTWLLLLSPSTRVCRRPSNGASAG